MVTDSAVFPSIAAQRHQELINDAARYRLVASIRQAQRDAHTRDETDEVSTKTADTQTRATTHRRHLAWLSGKSRRKVSDPVSTLAVCEVAGQVP